MSRLRRAAAALSLGLLVTACGGGAAVHHKAAAAKTIGYQVVRASSLTPDAPLPAPKGAAVLTVTGKVRGGSIKLDLATLERLPIIQYAVNDKQAEGHVVTFRGVLLRDVLKAAGMTSGAKTMHSIALNDYAVDIPVSDTAAFPVMLATSVDGHRMPVSRYGPIRVIYPYGKDFALDPTIYDPRWIWQLHAIELR